MASVCRSLSPPDLVGILVRELLLFCSGLYSLWSEVGVPFQGSSLRKLNIHPGCIEGI